MKYAGSIPSLCKYEILMFDAHPVPIIRFITIDNRIEIVAFTNGTQLETNQLLNIILS